MIFVIILIILIILLVLILSIIGIGIYGLVSFGELEGVIIDKYFDPGSSYVTYVYNGKTSVPVMNYDDDDYVIVIEKEIDGEKRTQTVEVPIFEYENYNIGDYYKKEVE